MTVVVYSELLICVLDVIIVCPWAHTRTGVMQYCLSSERGVGPCGVHLSESELSMISNCNEHATVCISIILHTRILSCSPLMKVISTEMFDIE